MTSGTTLVHLNIILLRMTKQITSYSRFPFALTAVSQLLKALPAHYLVHKIPHRSYPEPDQYIFRRYFLKIHFDIILPCWPKILELAFPSRIQTNFQYSAAWSDQHNRTYVWYGVKIGKSHAMQNSCNWIVKKRCCSQLVSSSEKPTISEPVNSICLGVVTFIRECKYLEKLRQK